MVGVANVWHYAGRRRAKTGGLPMPDRWMPRPLRPTRLRLSRWWDPFTGDLAPARVLFRQTYGFAHDDKQCVDEVIVSLFRRYGDEHDDKMNVQNVIARLDEDGNAANSILLK